jgi:hypothetical protein
MTHANDLLLYKSTYADESSHPPSIVPNFAFGNRHLVLIKFVPVIVRSCLEECKSSPTGIEIGLGDSRFATVIQREEVSHAYKNRWSS